MAIWHGEAGKKKTGGKIKPVRKKRKFELGSSPTLTKTGPVKRKVLEGKAGIKKVRLLSAEFANVLDPKTKAFQKVKILDVVENKANPHYVRRTIVTKGAIIKTEIGNAKVTSRPSQHGVVNAIKID